MANIAEDWTGSNGAAWPAAWTTTPAGGTISIQSNRGRITTPATAWTQSRGGRAGVANGDLLLEVTLASIAGQYINIFVRNASASASGSGYSLELNPAGSTLALLEWSGGDGSDTSLNVGSFTYTAGIVYKVRFRFSGSTLQGKIWDAAAAEPGGWTVEAADTTFTAAGFIQLAIMSSAASARTVDFDNLTVTDLDAGVTGALAATMPAATAAVAGTVTQTGDLTTPLPAATASLTGDVAIPAVLAANLPTATATLTGDVELPHEVLDATLPLATASLTGTVTQTGALDATAPPATAAVAGTVTQTGQLTAATLPAASAALAGEVRNTGALAAALPLAEAAAAATTTPPDPWAFYVDDYEIDGWSLASDAVRIEVAEGLQDAAEPVGDLAEVFRRDGAWDPYGGTDQPRPGIGVARITFNLWLKGVNPDTGDWGSDELSARWYFRQWDDLVRRLFRRRVTIRHPRIEGPARYATARLVPGESITPVRQPASPWFGRLKATYVIPDGTWYEDTPVTTGALTLASGAVVDLSVFGSATAPTPVEVRFGPGNNPQLATGYNRVRWAGVIASGRQAVYDAVTGRITRGSGSAWPTSDGQPGYGGEDYAPGPGYFEVDPSEPLTAVFTHTGGGTAQVEVAGVRRHRTS